MLCFIYLSISFIFAANVNHEGLNMLGIESKREPIKEPFASQIQDAVHRIATGRLNDEDKRIIKESEKRSSAYHAVWK